MPQVIEADRDVADMARVTDDTHPDEERFKQTLCQVILANLFLYGMSIFLLKQLV